MNQNKKIIYNFFDNFVDFPNKYSITLFFKGCNLNCPFCYNKHVITDEANFSIKDVLEKKSRIENSLGKMNIGIVFSGGEPTVQKDFNEIINIFEGNPLSIHTNGLILPEDNNPFESVVLSLKSSECGIPNDYIDKLRSAIHYYKNCKIKQLNVVKIDDYLDEYSDYISYLDGDLKSSGFEIKMVDEFKTK